jgi:uncharacterized protein YbjT (DUF2867 family)
MILVTGAGGLTGRFVARELRGRAAVRLGLRDPRRPDHLVADAERVHFDFEDPASFAEALAGVTGVYLVRPPKIVRPDIFGPLLAAMRSAGVQRVVFLSVRGAESNPLLPHRRIERRIENSGIGWTHLRANDFMQNFETVHRADIKSGGEIWAPAGQGRATWVDVRDLAKVAARVLIESGHERRAYTLTGPEALSFTDAALLFSSHVGHRVEYCMPSLARFLWNSYCSKRCLGLTVAMAAVYSIQRFGMAAKMSSDLSMLLGRKPCTLDQYIFDYANLWQRGITTQ